MLWSVRVGGISSRLADDRKWPDSETSPDFRLRPICDAEVAP